jgi:hypothetical protein
MNNLNKTHREPLSSPYVASSTWPNFHRTSHIWIKQGDKFASITCNHWGAHLFDANTIQAIGVIKIQFTLEQGMNAKRGRRGIALLFF